MQSTTVALIAAGSALGGTLASPLLGWWTGARRDRGQRIFDARMEIYTATMTWLLDWEALLSASEVEYGRKIHHEWTEPGTFRPRQARLALVASDRTLTAWTAVDAAIDAFQSSVFEGDYPQREDGSVVINANDRAVQQIRDASAALQEAMQKDLGR